MKSKTLLPFLFLFVISTSCRGSVNPASPAVTQIPTTSEPSPTPETSTPTPAQEASQRPESIQRNVAYCVMDGVELKMDIYYPKHSEGKTPLAIFIHGGGWSEGDKGQTQGKLVPAMLDAGFTVASLNYRLAPEYPFPAQLEDVKCAVRSFRANAEQYGINPDRIGVWGPSAGGHLASMLGVTDPAAGFERGEYLDQSSRVQAVVDLFGPADLTIDFSRTFVNLKASVFANYDLAKASPIAYISPDDPPFLILQGDRDPVVPLSQSQLLYEAMIAGGAQAELVVVKDGDHGFTSPNTTPNREEITAMIVKFFEEQLK